MLFTASLPVNEISFHFSFKICFSPKLTFGLVSVAAFSMYHLWPTLLLLALLCICFGVSHVPSPSVTVAQPIDSSVTDLSICLSIWLFTTTIYKCSLIHPACIPKLVYTSILVCMYLLLTYDHIVFLFRPAILSLYLSLILFSLYNYLVLSVCPFILCPFVSSIRVHVSLSHSYRRVANISFRV